MTIGHAAKKRGQRSLVPAFLPAWFVAAPFFNCRLKSVRRNDAHWQREKAAGAIWQGGNIHKGRRGQEQILRLQPRKQDVWGILRDFAGDFAARGTDKQGFPFFRQPQRQAAIRQIFFKAATAWHTLGFDTSRRRATSTERTMPVFLWRTRMVSR